MTEFVCNVCGSLNRSSEAKPDREAASCTECKSNVRIRGLLLAMSMELFGMELTLAEFPRVKSLRGIGTSDTNPYAVTLAEKFDYHNTFFDREPRFDIANPPTDELGRYDFVISSDVLEHVSPPVETAFRSVCELLKPNGLLFFTVPYSLQSSMTEHYPDLHQFGFAAVGADLVLVNRTRAGGIQVFEQPVFHASGGGKSLELREFTEKDLKALLAGAGFREMQICGEDYAPFGVVHSEACSLPMVARKGDFNFSIDSVRDVVEEWRGLRRKFDAERKGFLRSYWFRLGRKLGFY